MLVQLFCEESFKMKDFKQEEKLEQSNKEALCSRYSPQTRQFVLKSFFLFHYRNKSTRKDTGYSTGSSREENRKSRDSKRKDKRKSRKDEDESPEKTSKKRRKSRESSKEEEEKQKA